ncbi:DUF805 domain-containing protein [Serratia sp. S1B]|nr:DUF805 domain-containing protein [Serratia sp. S1B]
MKGTILDFSIQANSGIISGENSQRYPFIGSEWKEQITPQRGLKVDFDVSPEGQALAIYLELAQNSSNTRTTASKQMPKSKDDYQFVDWFIKCLKNYANFNGRASRSEFWFFVLCKYTLIVIALMIDMFLETEGVFFAIVALGLLLPEWAVGCRRLHDIGKTGWSQLLVIIPFAVILLIIWWTKESDPQENQYGDATT